MLDALVKPILDANQRAVKSRRRRTLAQLSPSDQGDKMLSMSSLRKAIDRTSSIIFKNDDRFVPGSGSYARNLLTPAAQAVACICNLLSTAHTVLSQARLAILTSLCQNNALIQNLWTFIASLDETDGLHSFLEYIVLNPKSAGKEVQILILFCNCVSHLVT